MYIHLRSMDGKMNTEWRNDKYAPIFILVFKIESKNAPT